MRGPVSVDGLRVAAVNGGPADNVSAIADRLRGRKSGKADGAGNKTEGAEGGGSSSSLPDVVYHRRGDRGARPRQARRSRSPGSTPSSGLARSWRCGCAACRVCWRSAARAGAAASAPTSWTSRRARRACIRASRRAGQGGFATPLPALSLTGITGRRRPAAARARRARARRGDRPARQLRRRARVAVDRQGHGCGQAARAGCRCARSSSRSGDRRRVAALGAVAGEHQPRRRFRSRPGWATRSASAASWRSRGSPCSTTRCRASRSKNVSVGLSLAGRPTRSPAGGAGTLEGRSATSPRGVGQPGDADGTFKFTNGKSWRGPEDRWPSRCRKCRARSC